MEELEFETKEELKEILSSLPTEALFSISEEINVKWKKFEGEVSPKRDVNRMRCYLAICEHYFPKKRRNKSQKNSGWQGKEMPELLGLIDKFNLKRPKGGNEKICKMWCIRRLNDAGVDPLTGRILEIKEA